MSGPDSLPAAASAVAAGHDAETPGSGSVDSTTNGQERAVPDTVAAGPRGTLAANVKRLRLARGWSVRELSARTGTSKALISQIERAVANPTVEVLARIAHALDSPVDEILRARLTEPEIVRGAGFGPGPADETLVQLLFSSHERARFEMYRSALPPHARSHRSTHGAGSTEYVVVLRGTVNLVVGEHTHRLEEGDCARFASDEEHHYSTGIRAALTQTLIAYPD